MNKNLGNIVSILLILIMAFSPTFVLGADNLAAENDDTVSAVASEEVFGLYEMNVLNSLGIVSYTEGMLTKPVSNEEFAGAAGLIGGLITNYYQSNAVEMLVNGGYLPSACAYPNRTINYQQAVKGMVSVLGYDAAAQKNGGYPTGYLMQASNLKLTLGIGAIDNEADLTYDVLCVMMYNALEVKPFVQTGYGETEEYKKDEPVLKSIFDINKAYGRVTANSVTSFGQKDGYDSGYIEIDNVQFNNANPEYDNLFGYNVEYYYRTNGSRLNTLLYMELDNTANKIIQSDVNDGTYVKDSNIYYYTSNGKMKSAPLVDGYCLVYNKRVSDKGLESFEGQINGYVKLADTNHDGKYDFVEINAYDTIYVSRINAYTKQIFDKYDRNKSASFDDTDNNTRFIIRDESGNDIAFSAIKKGNVVSVLVSEDKKLATAIVSDNVISAVIDGISQGDENKNGYIYCGEKEYPVVGNLNNYIKDIELGNEYKIYLDFSGFVAGFEKSSGVFEVGMVVGTATPSKGLKKSAKIKIFKTSGQFAEYDFADNVIVDGDKCKTSTAARNALYKSVNGEDVLKSKLIRYCVVNEKIVEIDTAEYNKETESEESLHIVGDISNKSFSRDGQYLIAPNGTGIVYDSATTVIMSYRVDMEDNETEYTIINPFDLQVGYQIPNVAGYSTSLKTPDIEYVVLGMTKAYAEKMRDNNYVPMLFTGISKRKDENGNDKYCIHGLNIVKNIKIEKLVNDVSLLDGVENGDVLCVSFTFGGELSKVYKAYSAKDDQVMFEDAVLFTGDPLGTSSGTSPKWLHGRVYSSGNTYMYVVPESKADLMSELYFNDCNVVAVKRRKPSYFIYDTKIEKRGTNYLTTVTADSVNDYLNTGDGADRVLVNSYPTEYSGIIIFK